MLRASVAGAAVLALYVTIAVVVVRSLTVHGSIVAHG
jgi:hypothetical protein